MNNTYSLKILWEMIIETSSNMYVWKCECANAWIWVSVSLCGCVKVCGCVFGWVHVSGSVSVQVWECVLWVCVRVRAWMNVGVWMSVSACWHECEECVGVYMNVVCMHVCVCMYMFICVCMCTRECVCAARVWSRCSPACRIHWYSILSCLWAVVPHWGPCCISHPSLHLVSQLLWTSFCSLNTDRQHNQCGRTEASLLLLHWFVYIEKQRLSWLECTQSGAAITRRGTMLREGKCRSEKQTQCEPIDLLMPSARCDCRGGNLAVLPWRPGDPGPEAAGWRWRALKRAPALIPPPLLPPFP